MGMAIDQSDKVTKLWSDKDLSNRPNEENSRSSLLLPLVRHSRSKLGTLRSDVSRGWRLPSAYSLKLIPLTIFCVLFSLTLAPKALGQGAIGLNYDLPLDIGDTLPEVLWDLPLQIDGPSKGSKTIHLADYKGKLIILDFWATWCATCLESFPKVEALQKGFDGQVQFVLINAEQTKDTELAITRTLERVGLPTGIPFLHRDTVLQQYFPHRIVPHYIWIAADGTYLGSTSSGEISAANIRAALSGKVNLVHQKRDFVDYHPNMPLMGYLSAVKNLPLYQSSLFTGYIEGIGNSTGVSTVRDKLSRLYILNSPLSYLFRMAHRDELIDLNNNRLRFDQALSKDFVQQYLSPQCYESQYTYEVIKETPDPTDLYKDLKQTLTEYFGVTVSVDSIEVPVWHVRLQAADAHPDPGHGYLMTLGSLIHGINNRFDTPILIDSDIARTKVAVPRPVDSLEFTAIAVEKLIAELGFRIEKKMEKLKFAQFIPVRDKNNRSTLMKQNYGK